jgi:hypothetical protein
MRLAIDQRQEVLLDVRGARRLLPSLILLVAERDLVEGDNSPEITFTTMKPNVTLIMTGTCDTKLCFASLSKAKCVSARANGSCAYEPY